MLKDIKLSIVKQFTVKYYVIMLPYYLLLHLFQTRAMAERDSCDNLRDPTEIIYL